MSFLPKGYKEPVKSNYLTPSKLEEGQTTFRVLGSAVIGWEYWTPKLVDGEMKDRPVRVKEEEQIPVANISEGKYGPQIYYFWAFPVFNIDDNRIQIAVIKQKTIRKAMKNYSENPKWGDPKEYDFIISKEVSEGRPEYSVSVNPKDKLDPNIIQKFKSMNIDMQVWMNSEDPFKQEDKS